MKLSRRLQAIADSINHDYDHLWDCCCDHGYLGLHLLQRYQRSVVHFVDIVPEIMDSLGQQLATRSSDNGRYQLHTINAGAIQLSSEHSHLVIIAGIGGELLAKMVTQIVEQHPDQALDFVLCPIHHQYHLRCRLIDLGLSLVSESIVHENKRFYELIAVSTSAGLPISPTGDTMWRLDCQTHQAYLNRLISHYAKQPDKHEVLEAYRRIKL